MKQTDFAVLLHRFLTDYLVNVKCCSVRTIDSYRYAFIFLMEYLEQVHGVKPERIQMSDLSRQTILGYLEWLETKKGCAVATRNQRQAAIFSFLRYVIYERPELLAQCQDVLGIPIKKTPQKEISYLKADGVQVLMEGVDTSETNGLRDYAMLMLLCTTGIRVSELIQLRVQDISFSEPSTMLVHGKGGKSRFVPLFSTSVPVLRKYLEQQRLDRNEKQNEYLFQCM